MRVLLDANILISYLLTPKGTTKHILAAAAEGYITLILPVELLDELKRKITHKPYLAERITQLELELFIKLLGGVGERLPLNVTTIPMTVPDDPKDSYLIAYAMLNQVDYLVTGDKGLLILDNKIKEFSIVTLKTMADICRGL